MIPTAPTRVLGSDADGTTIGERYLRTLGAVARREMVTEQRPHGEDVTLFTAVDRTNDPDFFRRFLDEGNALPAIRASKAMIVERLRLRGGESVLDAGCGTGADVFELAAVVGSSGKVVGIDVSETMVAEARRRAATLDLPVEFELGDAQSLRFPDGAFDAYRTERMLMHVPDAERALAEMIRVTRPGGRICVFDFDWETVVVDSPDCETTRAIIHSFADGIRHGWIGRQLPRLFRESGMTDVSVTPHPVFIHYEFAQLLWGGHLTRAQRAGVVSPGQVERWWGQLREANAAGTFLAGLTAFIVAGTKGYARA
jgi:ubiquinone/menaquinone biosynthesis C-methylase UbiE